jgi:N-acetylneuraminate lyase
MSFRLIAPPFTPLHANGTLNLGAVENYVEMLVSSRAIDGAFVAGSTGEGMLLTVSERQELAAAWVAAARSTELQIIIQVGHNCQADAVALARHAAQIGGNAISAAAPSYFKPATVEDLIDFLAPIAAAAAELPFYFYDIPMLTHVELSMPAFLAKAGARIRNLAGLKYTNDDLVQLQHCLRVQEQGMEILFGRDQLLLAAYAWGVRGAVGSTYNLMPGLYRDMLAAFDAGDHQRARQLQARSIAVIEALEPFGFLAAAKYVMGRRGLECGPVRAPLRNLTPPQCREIDQRLAELEVPLENPATE